MADHIERTATQCRVGGGTIHKLVSSHFSRSAGRVYRTRCGKGLAGVEGAMLTTRDADCNGCLTVGAGSLRGQQDMVGAILARLA